MLFKDSDSQNLDAMLAEHQRGPNEWSEPTQFDLSLAEDRNDLQAALKAGEVVTSNDSIEAMANELFEIQNPKAKMDEIARAEFVGEVVAQGSEWGKWFVFPWSKEVRRYADQETHWLMRTVRDRELDSLEEKQTLYKGTVALFGLSVGSNVLESLVQAGVGSKLLFGDGDVISPSNLNRITGNLGHVGERKLDHVAMNVSEIDPYIKQVHFKEGATADNLDVMLEHRPDVIFDEVDNLAAKAMLRLFAQENEIPLVMATDADKSVIVDVERYDQKGTKPFLGALSNDEVKGLAEGGFSPQEKAQMTIRIVGQENISSRLLDSFMKVQSGELPGIPQLGITAKRAGALAVTAARQIILGEPLATGRYPDNAMKTFAQ